MLSRILQLTVESRDLSQADKKLLFLPAEQLTKWRLFSNRSILSEFCEFAQLATTVFFFQLEINHEIQQSTEES